ncbi:general stress protein, partial [Lasius niger]
MIRLSIRHVLFTGYIHTSDKGNVQCPETETLINQPSQLVKRIENIMNNAVIEYDKPESELLTGM